MRVVDPRSLEPNSEDDRPAHDSRRDDAPGAKLGLRRAQGGKLVFWNTLTLCRMHNSSDREVGWLDYSG